ncbi:MAG: tRNA dihydrouridine synthase DusB [Bacteroidales bacterium]
MKIDKLDLGVFPLLLAPLEDITDSSFRQICRQYGADMVYTEFVSSEGLIRDARKSQHKIHFEESERPIGIQIFGNEISSMQRAAEMATEANPELIDINFGCPVKKVAMKGSGAGMLKDIPKMIRLTEAVVRATKLPVTVKTRLGWDENHKNIVEIAERLQDVGIKAITIHGRTRAQMYSGVADWTLIGEVKNNPRMHIPVIGNGDIDSPEKAVRMFDQYGVDALMIGRAAIGNPWIFKSIRIYYETGQLIPSPSVHERIGLCRIHLQKAIEVKGELRGILEMRRHYASYFKSLPDFKKHRLRLLTLTSLPLIDTFLKELQQNIPSGE